MKVFLLGTMSSWLIIMGLSFAQGPAATASPVASGREFMIFYANDVRGEIDPCG